MTKWPGSVYDKWNISVVICVTAIGKRSNKTWYLSLVFLPFKTFYLLYDVCHVCCGIFNALCNAILNKIKTQPSDKRNDFTFPIVIFSFINNNISAAFTYGIYISQIGRCSRLVCATVIFLTLLRCWCKCYSNNATTYVAPVFKFITEKGIRSS